MSHKIISYGMEADYSPKHKIYVLTKNNVLEKEVIKMEEDKSKDDNLKKHA